jgi:hypothetical protein
VNLRTIAIVTAVLVAAALIGAFVQNRSGRRAEEPARVGKPVLDAQSAQDAAKLRFDAGGEHATLRSTPNDWVVEEALDFPVQRDFLSQFLFKLTEIKIERFVTGDPAVFAELGVLLASENGGKAEKDKTGVEFQILDEQGKSRFHVVFGNRRKGADDAGVTGSGGMYLRDLEEKAVYLLSGAPRVIAKPTDWIQGVVLQLESKKDIKAFRVDRPGKPEIVLTRVGEPPEKVDFETQVDWTLNALPAGRKLSMRAVGEVAKGIGDLFLVNVTDPNQSPEKLGRAQVSRVNVETFEGIRYTFTVGEKEDKEGFRYMTAEASLAPGVDKPELKKKVEEYNRVFKGRMLVVHNWVGQRIMPDRDALLEEKS